MTATLPRMPGAITRSRMRYLYLFLGLIQAEVADITGLSRSQIAAKIREWNLTWNSDEGCDARMFWTDRAQRELGVSGPFAFMDPRVSERAHALQRDAARAALERGIDWAFVDATCGVKTPVAADVSGAAIA